MYSRAEATQLRQAFWTAFGQYMAPVLSAEGEKVNWPNYKTGIKHVYFRMRADTRTASIGIELTHPDAGIRELFFEQFVHGIVAADTPDLFDPGLGDRLFISNNGQCFQRGSR